jgi:hypothetical protein
MDKPQEPSIAYQALRKLGPVGEMAEKVTELPGADIALYLPRAALRMGVIAAIGINMVATGVASHFKNKF